MFKALKKLLIKIYTKFFRARERYVYKHKPREVVVKNTFKRRMGYELDLNNPITFNEKICWFKVNYFNPLAKICSDKYGVREYLKALGYEELLIENFGAWGDVTQIKMDELPDKPFILKFNHGCGGSVICQDKNSLTQKDLKSLRRAIKNNLNYASRAQEWVYEDMTPMILCEKLLVENGHTPLDYKIICNNGKVKCLYVCKRHNCKQGKLELNYYDRDFNLMQGRQYYPNIDGEIKKPENYDKMIALAEELSKPFPFVRVDFYNINGKIYFGEFTFFPSGGALAFQPEELDRQIGDMIELPAKQRTPFNHEK